MLEGVYLNKMENTEVWKDIPKLKGLYQVSNLGRIKNVIKDKIRNTLKADKISNCFEFIKVSYKGDSIYDKFWIHDAVINTFFPETIDKEITVTHLDSNKSNNNIINLKWEFKETIDKSLFVDIVGYEGTYSINKNGDIISHFENGKVEYRKFLINETGYCYIQLWKNNKGKSLKIHRLVAQSFIPNPNNKPHVNHKNGIKTDNRVENLEWCTRSENMIHAYSNGLLKKTIEGNNKLSEKYGTKNN